MPSIKKSNKRKAHEDIEDEGRPTLKLSHRLFVSPRGVSKKAESSPSKKRPSPPPPKHSPSPPQEIEEEPIYRGSIAHLVLKKVYGTDPEQLENYSGSEAETEEEESEPNPDVGKQEQPSGKSTALSSRESLAFRYATEMPEIEFRTSVKAQPPQFRQGDRVRMSQGGVYLGDGYVLDIVSASCYMVQTSDGLGLHTLHASQMKHVDRGPKLAPVSVAKKAKRRVDPSRIRRVFFTSLDSELTQEDKSVARIGIEDLPKIDFVATARSLALEALEELGGNKKKQGIK